MKVLLSTTEPLSAKFSVSIAVAKLLADRLLSLRPLSILAVASVLLGSAQVAFSQTTNYYWKDGLGNGRWDYGNNQWYIDGGGNVGVPRTDGGAVVYLQGNGSTTTYINSGFTSGYFQLNSLLLDSNSSGRAYVINVENGGTGIGLFSKMETKTGSGSLTLNCGVKLLGSSEINAVGNSLSLSNLDMNSQTLNSYGGNTLNITGVISGGGTYNIKNQGLTVNYSGSSANTFTGTTTVESSSKLVLNKSANIAAIAGFLTINTGATVDTSAANQLNDQLVSANGTLNLKGNSQSTALAGAGTVNLDGTSGSGTLTIKNTASDTFSGIITDNARSDGALIKTGAGTQILTGANSYDGTTTISQGVLQLGNDTTTGSLATTSAITNNANLTIKRNDAVVQGSAFSGSAITGSGSLTQAGSGSLTLNVANSYQGGTNINAGTLIVSAANALGTVGTVKFGGGTLRYSGGTSTTDYSARITNSGSAISVDTNGQSVAFGTSMGSGNTGGLTKLGSGTLTLNATNTYSGNTTIGSNPSTPGGTIQLGVTNALPVGTTLVFNGGTTSPSTLNLAGFSQTVGSLNDGGNSSGLITNTGSAATFTLNNTDSLNFYYGNITGLINFVKSNSGTQEIGGANTFTGTSTIKQGTIVLGVSNVNTTTGALGVSTNNILLGDTTASSSLTASLFIGRSGGVGPGSNGGFNFSNNIFLQDTTSGDLTLGGQNTSGTNTFSGNISLGNSSNTGKDLKISSAAGQVDFTGNIIKNGTNATAGVTISAGGIVKFTGNNTYRGDTTVNSGELDLATSGANGTTIVALNGNVVIGNGVGTDTVKLLASNQILNTTAVTLNGSAAATLDLNDNSQTIGSLADNSGFVGSGSSFVKLGSGTLTVGDSTNTGFSGSIQGTNGNLIKQGSGTLTFKGAATANTYTGTTTVNAGELDLFKNSGVNSIAGNLSIGDSNGTDTVKLLTSEQISDTAAVVINANGVTGNGVFDMRGSAANQSETIGSLASAGSDQSTASVVLGDATKTGTSTLNVGDTTSTTFAGAISGTGILNKQGTGTLILSGNNSYGNTTITTGKLQLGAGGSTGTAGTGSISVGGGTTLAFNRVDVNPTFANAINLPGSSTGESNAGFFDVATGTSAKLTGAITATSTNGQEFWKSGSGTLVVNNSANNFTTSVVIKSGTLQTDSLSTGGSTSSLGKGGIFIGQDGSGILSYSGATATTDRIGSFALQGATSNTIDVSNSATNLTISTAIGETGTLKPLTKTGAGTLTLSAANTYSGTTTISAGKLLVNNTTGSATGSGQVSVGLNGSLLSGAGSSGSISGLVTTSGTTSVIAPGATAALNTGTVGTLTLTGGLNIALGASISFDLGANSAASDLIRISAGTFTSGTSAGSVTFNFNNAGVQPGTFTLINYSGATASGFDLSDFTATGIAGTFQFGTNSLQFVTAVPEPSTWVGAGLITGLAAFSQRKRLRAWAA